MIRTLIVAFTMACCMFVFASVWAAPKTIYAKSDDPLASFKAMGQLNRAEIINPPAMRLLAY